MVRFLQDVRESLVPPIVTLQCQSLGAEANRTLVRKQKAVFIQRPPWSPDARCAMPVAGTPTPNFYARGEPFQLRRLVLATTPAAGKTEVTRTPLLVNRATMAGAANFTKSYQ